MGFARSSLEAVTWAQLGIHRKPLGLLNVEGFFDPLVELIDNAIRKGFIAPKHRDLLVVDAAKRAGGAPHRSQGPGLIGCHRDHYISGEPFGC